MNSEKIYGLILSGGKSTRMGIDKGMIDYHGMPQREYLYKLLKTLCHTTYMSVREEQVPEFSQEYNLIVDRNEYKGPYNGLLSAHHLNPKASWLVLACDLPLIDQTALKELIRERDCTKLATAFATEESGLPEPLCAIWEPEGLEKSVAYLNAGNGSCPRKFLINGDIHLVVPQNEEVLLNANYKEDYEKVLMKLS
ncbi:Molybdenum cofactor guanylyltransferase [Arenibacter antarcticus]|uniref:Probable molybdenum cofactor guanylyltransferase n=1 Tax=Arenibacter antarcticus TaxID=2040469 RepID=A0ABW5VF12_9FLAO|nr:NTP transferase domain-containing protein [Arenibacter sp. H213]MCM4166282.1 molybdenum cofactor guanylyltransferase [Arenibacter sp. H213]